MLIFDVAAVAEEAVGTHLALLALAHKARLAQTHLLRSEAVCPIFGSAAVLAPVDAVVVCLAVSKWVSL